MEENAVTQSNFKFYSIATEVLGRAEKLARKGGSFKAVLAELRNLSFEDFSLFLFHCPNPAYPALSKLMPRMADAKHQKGWTGTSGMDLFKQSTFFMRLIESNYARFRKDSFENKTFLDFGCGYSRYIRMLYYFTQPDQIWGVDPWDRSLNISKEDGVKANFVLSETVPTWLDVPDKNFDVIFAYSVFTHLSERSTHACLDALLPKMKDDGLLLITVRPVEFWPFIDGVRGTNLAPEHVEQHHRDGFAYYPSDGALGKEGSSDFGDTSFELSLFENTGWNLLGIDRVCTDPYQIICALEPK
jgi:SAM-dependent methyltransferase